jgi:intraflagellar transport protein 122
MDPADHGETKNDGDGEEAEAVDVMGRSTEAARRVDDFLDEAEAAATSSAPARVGAIGGGAAAGLELTPLREVRSPTGVSTAAVLYAIGKLGPTLGAFRMSRVAAERSVACVLPAAWRDVMDAMAMSVQAQPFADKEALLPVCHRCRTVNPMANTTEPASNAARAGDRCVHCGQPFQRSFSTFDPLPLVEFVPAEGISDAQAVALMRAADAGAMDAGVADEDTEEADVLDSATTTRGGVQSLSLENVGRTGGDAATAGAAGTADSAHDASRAISLLVSVTSTCSHGASIFASSDVLSRIPLREVVVVPPPPGPARALGVSRSRFFVNAVPEVRLTACTCCAHLFHADDFEFALLRTGCPACGATTAQVEAAASAT